jgi:carbonic anhydrase
VELNVIEQCLNLYKTGVVQRKRMQTKELLEKQQAELPPGAAPINIAEEVFPRIYGMVFNPAEGQLKKLTVDFARRVGSLDHIYGLYKDNSLS